MTTAGRLWSELDQDRPVHVVGVVKAYTALLAQRAGLHLSLRVLSMQRVHHACPITVLMCAAAATLLPGTIPNAMSRRPGDGTIRITHPKGIAAAAVGLGDGRVVRSVSVTRTARRLLAGQAYL
jgi:2-methylaconitate cis-trans-isomerase PrpF